MAKYSRQFAEVAATVVVQGTSILVPLALTPVIAEAGGAPAFASVATAQAAAQYGRLMSEFGLELTEGRSMSLASGQEQSTIFVRVIEARLLAGSFSAVGVFIFTLLVVRAEPLSMAVGAAALTLGLVLDPMWLFRAVGSVLLPSGLLLITRGASLVWAVNAIDGPATVSIALVAMGVCQLAYIVGVVFIARRRFVLFRFSLSRAVRTLRANLSGLQYKIGQSLFVGAPALIYMLGAETASARYAVGDRVFRGIAGGLLYPVMYFCFPYAVRGGRSRSLTQASVAGLGVCLLAAAALIASAPRLGSILGFPDTESIASIRLGAVALPVWFATQVLGLFTLSAQGRSSEFGRATLVGGLVVAVLCFAWPAANVNLSPGWILLCAESVVLLGVAHRVRAVRRHV